MGWCTCGSCCYVSYNRRRRTQLDTFWPFPVMGWSYRKNCPIACDTRAQFWWGRRVKYKQTKCCWKLPSWEVNKFHFLSLFSGEPLAATFLSDARQAEVPFCTLEPRLWTNLGANRFFKQKHNNTNLVVPRHIKKKKAYLWLTSVAQKRRCLNSPLTSNVRTTNGTLIMVITGMRLLLFLVGRYG